MLVGLSVRRKLASIDDAEKENCMFTKCRLVTTPMMYKTQLVPPDTLFSGDDPSKSLA